MEMLADFWEVAVGLAVVAALVYVGYQLREGRSQARADTLQRRLDTRIRTWQQQLEVEALHSAKDKFFEFELYREDATLHEIEELTLRERRALERELMIELTYFQNLFYQRTHQLIEPADSLPLDYMRCFESAPQRRAWKDQIRLTNHFPPDFVRHADTIVKKYDEVERRMAADEDADFSAVVADVFDLPAPPAWIS